MSSLFSIFDPMTGQLPLNWLSALTVGLMITSPFWPLNSQVSKAIQNVAYLLAQEFKALLGPQPLPGMILLNVSLFFFIWMNNFMGLAPYVFTASSHLSFTLAIALPLWAGHVVYAWWKTPQPMFAHLVPLGSPAALSPFMVIIELVSAIIRPVTLAVRLAANMVAGHLLMVLLSSPMASMSMGLAALALGALTLLAVLESAVATIQAYVFSILTVLYVNEVAAPLNSKSKTALETYTQLKMKHNYFVNHGWPMISNSKIPKIKFKQTF